MKLWAGRFSKEIDQKTNDFNSSIAFDCRMAQEDIAGSMAHAAMLAKQGIISREDGRKIQEGLAGIAADLQAGVLAVDPGAEDIHTFVEGELTARIGDAGKRLHTGRSRNDQVALDIRLYPEESGGPSAGAAEGAGRGALRPSGNPRRRHHARLYPSAAGAAHHLRPSSAGLRGDVPAGYGPS